MCHAVAHFDHNQFNWIFDDSVSNSKTIDWMTWEALDDEHVNDT